MNELYKRGFLDKCAELGIDPERLVKLAARGDQLLKNVAEDRNSGIDMGRLDDRPELLERRSKHLRPPEDRLWISETARKLNKSRNASPVKRIRGLVKNLAK